MMQWELSIEIYANPIADAGIDMNLDCFYATGRVRWRKFDGS